MSLLRRKITLDDGFKVGVVQSRIRRLDVPTIVFMHGWSVSAGAYTELLEHLEAQGFPVVALDAADHGDSDSLPWGHSIGDMADITARALEVLGVEKAVMIGHSMGGGMVAEFASRYPERTTAAILIDAAAGRQHHEAVQMALTADGLLRAAELITSALRDIIGDTVLAAQSRSVTELLSLGSRLVRSLSGPPLVKAGIALLRHDTSLALHRMKVHGVPTVVIHGEDDRIISERAARQTAHAAGAALEILPGYNHSWMLAQPQEAAERITKWARKIVRKTVDRMGTNGDGASSPDARQPLCFGR